MNPVLGKVIDLAREIQAIPAPSFGEGQRAAFVRQLFLNEQLLDVSIDPINNLYGRVAGASHLPPLVVSAHLDTVFSKDAIHGSSRSGDQIHGPGIGDNSLGVAALLGLIWLLRDRGVVPAADIWLIANVCEEGLGNLRGMKAVVDRFGNNVRGYLVIEGTALGHIYHKAVGVQRYRVEVHTAGGHSWSDYGQPSAIHEAAALITRITSVPLPLAPRTTLNVGLISGGTGINVLASEATFELDVRSEQRDALAAVTDRLEAAILSSRRGGVDVRLEKIGQRPAGEIPADHPLVQLAGECLTELGLPPVFTSGSTDANVPLSMGYPAIVLGVSTGGGAHTLNEYIDVSPIETGLEQLVRFVERVFRSA